LLPELVVAESRRPVEVTDSVRAARPTFIFARSARQALLRIDGIAEVLQTYSAKGAAQQIDALMHELMVDANVAAHRREAARVL
jgi:hypothetical protein